MSYMVNCEACLTEDQVAAGAIFCRDCGQVLCDKCLKQHRKFKGLVGHTILGLPEYRHWLEKELTRLTLYQTDIPELQNTTYQDIVSDQMTPIARHQVVSNSYLTAIKSVENITKDHNRRSDESHLHIDPVQPLLGEHHLDSESDFRVHVKKCDIDQTKTRQTNHFRKSIIEFLKPNTKKKHKLEDNNDRHYSETNFDSHVYESADASVQQVEDLYEEIFNDQRSFQSVENTYVEVKTTALAKSLKLTGSRYIGINHLGIHFMRGSKKRKQHSFPLTSIKSYGRHGTSSVYFDIDGKGHVLVKPKFKHPTQILETFRVAIQQWQDEQKLT
ncbi:hypothetical protein MAR_036553 [Mya arenaria]|uniref:B box-type domain-containing protein n=1 Tax=Mya arenaria TaxID=6604 RepID=A0ABY7FP19_MYAAR|nr:uncharacterized protein LOC128214136 [Mya arenaria]WAR22884.1 hypothetical protein MAR_036553 [Mya arenaria]